MQAKIRIEYHKGSTEKVFWQAVEAEPLTIKGFETLDLFIDKRYICEDSDSWYVTEAVTGLSIAQDAPTREQAVELATTRLQKKGVDYVLKMIASFEPINKFKEYQPGGES